MQVALEDREREERSGGGSRGGDGAAAARRHRSLDAWVEGEGEPDRNGAAKADSDGTAKMTRRRERRWITSAAPAVCGATRRTEVVAAVTMKAAWRMRTAAAVHRGEGGGRSPCLGLGGVRTF
ncbi:hypothetical protein PLESTM_000684800 [Pleodorina starrii]|nr:hypothetical protein PLESTM_000684800 [Pleodorina starrii]